MYTHIGLPRKKIPRFKGEKGRGRAALCISELLHQ